EQILFLARYFPPSQKNDFIGTSKATPGFCHRLSEESETNLFKHAQDKASFALLNRKVFKSNARVKCGF
ncbi:hypothetical protein, partial [Butyricicoccus sp.]|uniref:hypothetical protein n=1 Tax=Butyricicoccus sp. TaxID=2049021 RepID=UPI003F140B23